MSERCEFPSGVAALRLVQGEPGGLTSSIDWTLRRSTLLLAGMYLAGERERLLKKALVGSLAVEAVVIADVAIRQHSTVTSARAVLAGNPLAIAATYLGRSTAVAAGLYLAGERRNVWRNAFAGCALIEATVLGWAAQCRQGKPLT